MSQPLPEPIQFGKYTLFERVGRGGMADVFKGRIQGPEGFERVFVVKRILPHLSDDPAFKKMFVEEAKLSARLNHPNIVHIFELGSVDGEMFISMEHVRGHDLGETMRALWKTSGPPRADLVAYIGREMCRALAYAHALTDERGQLLGMIHRDVSPSNVMLSYEGSVKLLDFGIAKALGDAQDLNRSGSLKGKYAYMAPEQTEGDDIDHRIDIFSAGIVLHEVLTGRRLFKGQNDMQTIERVRRCEVRLPSQLNPSCPPELDAVLFRALARDRHERFQTAGEMADALDEIVHAAHFTPERMATILRATFGADKDPVTGLPVDRRAPASANTNASSPQWPATSTTASTSSSSWRSPTIPPIPVPDGGPAATATAVPSGTLDTAALRAIRPKPLWKRVSMLAIGVLCVGGIGLAITRVGPMRGSGSSTSPAAAGEAVAAAPPVSAPHKVKKVPVLIQTDPEGADIYVAGRLESLGTTPTWLPLEIDKNNPARVMVRKAGFQDKAVAIDTDKPATVRMLPVGLTDTAAAHPSGESGAGKGETTEHTAGAAKAGEGSRASAQRGGKWHPPATGKASGELVDPF